MSNVKRRPYGSWSSPITADLLAQSGVSISEPQWDDGALYWLEGRPTEGGRYVIVRRDPDGTVEDVLPEGFNARTRVHEYGGGAYRARGDVLVFANFDDQRLYRIDGGGAPRPITPEPASARSLRYADMRFSPDGETIYCVRERHGDMPEAVNEIVSLPADGGEAPRVLVTGNDFYAAPRVRADGSALAWIAWNHPNMPWDGTELSTASFQPDGTLGAPERVAGGETESIFQPAWSPDGTLHYVSDRTGWWNIYRVEGDHRINLAPMQAELGLPHWNFGMNTYTFLSNDRIAAVIQHEGRDTLTLIRDIGERTDVELPFSCLLCAGQIRGEGTRLALIAGSATSFTQLVTYDVETRRLETIRRSVDTDIDTAFVSAAQPIKFPVGEDENGETIEAYGYYYAPHNPHFEAPEGELPPLIVFSHGGPTGFTTPVLRLSMQFWTSRGFALVDVDYGGSTGYGRAYRERLNGNWGIVDTRDCVKAAEHLRDQGLVDGNRLAIRGGSAGGYTTLCALAFHDVFHVGASYFGVGDAEALMRDTHKFESRYGHHLYGGSVEEAAEIYRARSPINATDRISCPMILLQGLEDRVVSPAQAEQMIAALEAKGLPYAYVAFEGEQHGFRKAENIRRAAEAELYFYARVFGFEPADDIEPVEIANLPTSGVS